MVEPLNFRKTYCLLNFKKALMVKSCGKCKQTRFGTGDGLEQVNGLNGAVDGSWNNIHLNYQTGELTISNIQSDQTGVYKLEFDTSGMILHRKFRIDISGE